MREDGDRDARPGPRASDDVGRSRVPRTLHVRMGINTGFCTVGNFGSVDRLGYTIVGGQVNAAARLEAPAEPYAVTRGHGGRWPRR